MSVVSGLGASTLGARAGIVRWSRGGNRRSVGGVQSASKTMLRPRTVRKMVCTRRCGAGKRASAPRWACRAAAFPRCGGVRCHNVGEGETGFGDGSDARVSRMLRGRSTAYPLFIVLYPPATHFSPFVMTNCSSTIVLEACWYGCTSYRRVRGDSFSRVLCEPPRAPGGFRVWFPVLFCVTIFDGSETLF